MVQKSPFRRSDVGHDLRGRIVSVTKNPGSAFGWAAGCLLSMRVIRRSWKSRLEDFEVFATAITSKIETIAG
jgi:hypothetical protein